MGTLWHSSSSGSEHSCCEGRLREWARAGHCGGSRVGVGMAPGKPPLSPFLLRRELKARRGCSGGWVPPFIPPSQNATSPCGALLVEVVAGPCAVCQLRSAPGTRCTRCAGTGGHTPPCAPWHPRHGAAPARHPGVTPVPPSACRGEQLVPAERDPLGSSAAAQQQAEPFAAGREAGAWCCLCPACTRGPCPLSPSASPAWPPLAP